MGSLSRREQLQQANRKKPQAEMASSIVDDVISENSKNTVTEKKPVPVHEETITPELREEKIAKSAPRESIPSKDVQKSDIIRISPPAKKQTKSIRKCFLITPEMDDKLKKMASDYDTSENEIINQILSQVL